MNALVDKVRDLIEKKKAVTGRQGSIALRLHTLLQLSTPFSEVRKGLYEAVTWLEADGLVNLKSDVCGRVVGVYWIEEDGSPNYAWLKTLAPEGRAKILYERLLAEPAVYGVDLSTGLLKRALNRALVDTLNIGLWVRYADKSATTLIRELLAHGYLEKLHSMYCLVISHETRIAALEEICGRLRTRRDEQVAQLVETQTALFHLEVELKRQQHP